MEPNYEKFPEPEEIKSKDDKFTIGMNKSKRSWKVGLNRVPTKNVVNKGMHLTWEEKKKRSADKKVLR